MLVHTTERFVVTVETRCRSTSVNGINQELLKRGRRESTQNQITLFRRNNLRNMNFTYHETVRSFCFKERKIMWLQYLCLHICICVSIYVCMNVRLMVGMWVGIMDVTTRK
jgi:hypothetical protein